MASIHRLKPKRQSATKPKPVRTIEQYLAQPTKQQGRLANVAHALTSMRSDGMSLREAARTYGVAPRTVLKYGGSGLRKNASGRYAARASDLVPRALAVPTKNGVAEIVIRGSRQSSKLGRYWSAVQEFLETGDDSALRRFRGESVTDASGREIPLITDPDELEHLGSAGVLSFESIYARVA